jgi:hypothetical protein
MKVKANRRRKELGLGQRNREGGKRIRNVVGKSRGNKNQNKNTENTGIDTWKFKDGVCLGLAVAATCVKTERRRELVDRTKHVETGIEPEGTATTLD